MSASSLHAGAVGFDGPSHGAHRIQISSVGYVVEHGHSTVLVPHFFVVAGAALLAIAAGVVALIVSDHRRRKRLHPGCTGPGWYPNPNAPGTMLWWNGSQWVMPSTPGGASPPG